MERTYDLKKETERYMQAVYHQKKIIRSMLSGTEENYYLATDYFRFLRAQESNIRDHFNFLEEYLFKLNTAIERSENRVKMYFVWSEGYNATGGGEKAYLLGKIKAISFEDACILLAGKDLDKKDDGSIETRFGRPSIWACRLYDNEKDARKSHG